METGSISMALTLGLALLYMLISGGQGQLGDVPPCDLDRAVLCMNKAGESLTPSGCNWYRIIPPLFTCVDESVAGCTYDEQVQWYSYVDSFNATLQADDCYPGCANQAVRAETMFYCFDLSSFSSLALSISQDSTITPSSPDCLTLISMNNCLLNATGGCAALMDVSHARINSTAGGNAAYAQCGLTPYQPATTSAPLEVLNTPPAATNSPPSNSSSNGGVKGTDLLVIILGAILILSTICIIIVSICLARRRNAIKKRNILRDWRPNGQEVYRDEPTQIVKKETINFRSANEGGRVYRPHRVSGERDERQVVRGVYDNRGAVIYP